MLAPRCCQSAGYRHRRTAAQCPAVPPLLSLGLSGVELRQFPQPGGLVHGEQLGVGQAQCPILPQSGKSLSLQLVQGFLAYAEQPVDLQRLRPLFSLNLQASANLACPFIHYQGHISINGPWLTVIIEHSCLKCLYILPSYIRHLDLSPELH